MKKVELTGRVFGRLTVVAEAPRRAGKVGVFWTCVCECGTSHEVLGGNLRSGQIRSCGCLGRESSEKNRSKSRKHGGHTTATYRAWASMRQRCRDPKHHNYPQYGGRGISVCERWLHSFENFRADMGERPQGTTIDRRDTNGNYTPDNCRWATPLEQSNNKRNNLILEMPDGRKLTAAQAAREVGIDPQIVQRRLKRSTNAATVLRPIDLRFSNSKGQRRGVTS